MRTVFLKRAALTLWLQVVVKDSGATGDAYVFCALRFLVAAAGLSPFLARAAQDSQVGGRGPVEKRLFISDATQPMQSRRP